MLIGNTAIQSYLQKAAKNGIVPHAQLWVGPEHVGKTTFLKSYLEWLQVDWLVGVRWYPAGELDMEAARGLIQDTTESSLWGGQRFIVIEQAEQLRYQVYNALLKVLEEPRSRVTLILLASDVATIPATVKSRCSLLWFQRVSDVELLAAVPAQAKLVPLAHGLPGIVLNWKKASAAQKWLQQIVHWAEVLQQSPVERIAAANDKDLQPAMAALETTLYAVLTLQTEAALQSYPASLQEPIQQLASQHSLAATVAALGQVAQLRRSLEQPVQPKLVMTNLLLNMYPCVWNVSLYSCCL